jgi:hypothetical protein
MARRGAKDRRNFVELAFGLEIGGYYDFLISRIGVFSY